MSIAEIGVLLDRADELLRMIRGQVAGIAGTLLAAAAELDGVRSPGGIRGEDVARVALQLEAIGKGVGLSMGLSEALIASIVLQASRSADKNRDDKNWDREEQRSGVEGPSGGEAGEGSLSVSPPAAAAAEEK